MPTLRLLIYYTDTDIYSWLAVCNIKYTSRGGGHNLCYIELKLLCTCMGHSIIAVIPDVPLNFDIFYQKNSYLFNINLTYEL